MRIVTIELPDDEAAALERAVADGGFDSTAALVRAALGDYLGAPAPYDADALSRDVAGHRAEKARGEPGFAPEAARAWLRDARPD